MNRIVTIATPEIKDISRPFLDNQRAYAEANGYEYVVHEKKLYEPLHPSFSKVWAISEALDDGADWIISADADVAFLVMNHDLKTVLTKRLADRPELFLSGKEQLNWPHWKYLCAGLLVIRGCDYAKTFVAEWKDRCIKGCPDIQPGKRTMIEGMPFENWHFDALNRKTQFHGIYAARANEMGCFCETIWTDGEAYTPGTPAIHFAGPASAEAKAQAFKEKYEQLVH